MKINAHDQYDHRLDTLEARSAERATMPHAGTQAAATVVIADASFLNAGSDPSPAVSDAASQNDADMYDFGAAWGTQPSAAAGEQVSSHFADSSAIVQDNNRPNGLQTPADIYGLATFDYGAAAPYNGAAPVITQNADPVPDNGAAADAQTVHAPAPTQPPAVTITAPAVQAAQPPQAMVISSSMGDSSITWLDGGMHKPVGSGAVADPVVILSTFMSA